VRGCELLVVDEAAQATEISALIPLRCGAPLLPPPLLHTAQPHGDLDSIC
jgi:hypothetical protein